VSKQASKQLSAGVPTEEVAAETITELEDQSGDQQPDVT
jgi:hypothetical protein